MSARKCIAEVFLQIFERIALAIGFAAALVHTEVLRARAAYRAVRA